MESIHTPIVKKAIVLFSIVTLLNILAIGHFKLAMLLVATGILVLYCYKVCITEIRKRINQMDKTHHHNTNDYGRETH